MTDEPTRQEIIAADRQEKEERLRSLKRRDTPFLQAAGELKQLGPKIKQLEDEIADAHDQESEAANAA